MASGNFSGEEHPHQPSNSCYGGANVTMTRSTSQNDSSIAEIRNSLKQMLNLLENKVLSPSTRECCCKGVTNLGEKWMQDFFTGLKPLIGEEVEKVLARVLRPNLHSLKQCVLPPNSSSLPTPGCYRLSFKGKLPDEMLTFNNIEEEGASLEVELLDEFDKRVEVGLDSDVMIKIEVLDGDFDAKDRYGWSEEDFKRFVVRPRDNKLLSLLKGNNQFSLNRGVAGVCGFSFTDNSSSMRNKKFRLGAQVIGGLPSGRVVRSAVSNEKIRVKDCRLKSDLKHSTPSPEDDLWRLENISKTGPVCCRAMENNIHTVKDFLQLYHTDEKKLKTILNIPETKWAKTVKNAKECKLTTEHYRYYDDASGNELILDCAFNIKRVTFKGRTTQFYEHLDLTHKEKACKLRLSAYEKRNRLEIHDDSTNQVSIQGLEYPSCALQQEQEKQQQQPAAAPPPFNNPNLGSFSPNMVATTSGQIYSNASVLCTDTRGTYQAEVLPLQAPNHGLDYPEIDSFNSCYQGLPGNQIRNAKQNELPQINTSTNQTSDQELTNLSFFQRQPVQSLPPPGWNYNNGSGFGHAQDAISHSMGIIPPTNVNYDAAGADQAYQASRTAWVSGQNVELFTESPAHRTAWVSGQNVELSTISPARLTAWVSGDNSPSVAVNNPVQISDHRLHLPMSLPREKCSTSYPFPNIPVDTEMLQVNNFASLRTNSSGSIDDIFFADLLFGSEANAEDSQALSSPNELRTKTSSRRWRILKILVRLRIKDDYRPLKKQKT